MAKALTFTQIKALKPKDKLYKPSDGGGLSLWVYLTGRMRWAPQKNLKNMLSKSKQPSIVMFYRY